MWPGAWNSTIKDYPMNSKFFTAKQVEFLQWLNGKYSDAYNVADPKGLMPGGYIECPPLDSKNFTAQEIERLQWQIERDLKDKGGLDGKVVSVALKLLGLAMPGPAMALKVGRDWLFIKDYVETKADLARLMEEVKAREASEAKK